MNKNRSDEKKSDETTDMDKRDLKSDTNENTPSATIEDKNKVYKSFVFTRGSAWLLVIVLTLGALAFNLLRMFVFRVKATLPDYEWSGYDEFDVKDYQTLYADNDGNLTLLQLSDLHLLNGNCSFDRQTLELVEKLVNDVSPDLVVVTGDVVTTLNNLKIFKKAIIFFDELCAKYNTRWCLVFGNNDAFGYGDKTALADALLKSKYCMFQVGPTNLSLKGHSVTLGNYAINVADSQSNYKCSLVMMDSNDKGLKKTESKYASVTPMTIEWYEWFVDGMTKANGGVSVPSLAFFHTPLPENKMMLSQAEIGKDGFNEEISPSTLNTGLYDLMLKSGTVAAFCGQDHQNFYQGYYDGGSVLLAGCMSCGYCTYGDKAYKGGRVIKLNVSQSELVFDTYPVFAA